MKKIISIFLCLTLAINTVAIFAKENGNGNASSNSSQNSDLYSLKVNTNNKGSVSLSDGDYEEGEFFEFTVTPDDGYYLDKINSSKSEVVKITENLYSFTMPPSKVTLTFVFKEGTGDADITIEEDTEGSDTIEDDKNDTLFEEDTTNDIPDLSYKPFKEEDIMESSIEDYKYVNGEVVLIANTETKFVEIKDIIEPLGGEIVGYLKVANVFQVFFEEGKTEEELISIVEDLNNNDKLIIATMNKVEEMPTGAPSASGFVGSNENAKYYDMVIPKDALWANEWETYINNGIVEGKNWGLEAIDAPVAWTRNDEMSEINIGIYDTWFDTGHDDIDFENIITTDETNSVYLDNPVSKDDDEEEFNKYIHGTHISGIIGAKRDEVGITGLIWNSKLYGFSSVDYTADDSIFKTAYGFASLSESATPNAIHGFEQNDVLLINWSMGSTNRPTEQTIEFMTNFLKKYIEKDYEFLIVQAAGNLSNKDGKEWVDATEGSIFANITDEEVRSRIIVVGAFKLDDNGGYETYFHTCIGEEVEIMAPGGTIQSTIPEGEYLFMSGTSQAAPHVTGVAGMIWALEPNLTGAEVKQRILDNTHGEIEIVSNGVVQQTIPILNAGQAVVPDYDANVEIIYSAQDPIIIDGRAVVPVRELSESAGFEVEWNPDSRTITLTKDNTIAVMVIDQMDYTVNGVNKTFDVPPTIIDDITYLPLRAIAEDVLGLNAFWNAPSRTATVVRSNR